eukprot:76664-Pyramimonas_sp.AAC.1
MQAGLKLRRRLNRVLSSLVPLAPVRPRPRSTSPSSNSWIMTCLATTLRSRCCLPRSRPPSQAPWQVKYAIMKARAAYSRKERGREGSADTGSLGRGTPSATLRLLLLLAPL